MRAFVSGIAMLLAVSPAGAGMMPVADLRARVEAFAGRPAMIDPRLLVPECAAAPALAWSVGGRSVVVRCGMPAWEVFVPVVGEVAATPASPVIRRGERVVVEAAGNGFVVGVEAVAEQDSRDGRVALRAGGKRLMGIVGDDGRVRIRGLNGMVNGR